QTVPVPQVFPVMPPHVKRQQPRPGTLRVPAMQRTFAHSATGSATQVPAGATQWYPAAQRTSMHLFLVLSPSSVDDPSGSSVVTEQAAVERPRTVTTEARAANLRKNMGNLRERDGVEQPG